MANKRMFTRELLESDKFLMEEKMSPVPPLLCPVFLPDMNLTSSPSATTFMILS